MPPVKNRNSTRPLNEQIEELRAKITLLDGDRKAYYESSTKAKKDNRETIAQLRKENKELRKELTERLSADDHVINQAFQNKPVERKALSNKSGSEAITSMDYKVCDTKKKLNALKHITAKKERRLHELQVQYEQNEQDFAEARATDAGESKDAQTLRDLENRLDKAQLKCSEADHIRKTYEQIKSRLQEEHMTFGNTLDDMETEIRQTGTELEELKTMHQDAEIARDNAQAELKRIEDKVYADRKARELEMQTMKREAEEKKLQHEKIEKRIAARGSISQGELSQSERNALFDGGEQQAKIVTYEEAFKKIKEATGVSDLKEVVERFETQGETRKNLEDLKKENEKNISRLTEEKENRQREFEEMKYSGEAKMSKGQQILEQYQAQLQEETTRRENTHEELARGSGVLVQCKAGVEHLYEKLSHIKTSKGHAAQAQISASSDEYVLDLLSKCEEKLLKLMEELQDVNVDQTLEKMQQEEFHTTIESKLPQYNTRVKLPTTQKDANYDDDDESGDDDGEVMTRQSIKKQSQQLIDTKTKKRAPRKKKKGK